MAADVIDQLVITLGLDSTELGVRLKEVEALLNQNGASLIEFLEGFEQGLVEGMSEVSTAVQAVEDDWSAIAEAAGATANELNAVVLAADNVGLALQEAAQASASEVNKVATETEKVKKRLNESGSASVDFGRKFSQSMTQVVKSIIGPMALFALMMKTVHGVTGELSELDKLEQKNNLTKEETIQKERLLEKYGRDGLEGYRKGRDALNQIREAVTKAAWPIIQALIPAILVVTDKITRLSDWASNNGDKLRVVFLAIATVITAKVVPAIITMGAAFLRTPIGILTVALKGLFVLLDDLITYANDGETAFGGLWEMMGTPAEVKAGLDWIVETLKEILDLAKKISDISGKIGGAIADLELGTSSDDELFEKTMEAARSVNKEEFKSLSEQYQNRYHPGNIKSKLKPEEIGPLTMKDYEREQAAISSSIIAPVTNNTDQSQTTISNNITVNNTTPEMIAAYANEAINRSLTRNFNFGMNQAGGR